MTRADFPSLLTGSLTLTLTLFHPMANLWAALLAVTIIMYGEVLYAEHRVRYGPGKNPADAETQSEKNSP